MTINQFAGNVSTTGPTPPSALVDKPNMVVTVETTGDAVVDWEANIGTQWFTPSNRILIGDLPNSKTWLIQGTPLGSIRINVQSITTGVVHAFVSQGS